MRIGRFVRSDRYLPIPLHRVESAPRTFVAIYVRSLHASLQMREISCLELSCSSRIPRSYLLSKPKFSQEREAPRPERSLGWVRQLGGEKGKGMISCMTRVVVVVASFFRPIANASASHPAAVVGSSDRMRIYKSRVLGRRGRAAT